MSVTRLGTHSFTALESPFLDQEIVLRGPDGERDARVALDFWSGAPDSPDSSMRTEPEQEILGTTDDRALVTNTLRVPNQWICAIDVMSENPDWPRSGQRYICKSRGTGTLIGSRYVLTAAHIFGDNQEASLKLAKKHTVSPARNGNNSNNPFGAITTKAIHFPRAAVDYALLVLDKDVSASTHKNIKGPLGYWGQDSTLAVVKRLDPAGLQNQDIDIVGYAGDACGKSIVAGSGSDKTNKIEYCWQRRNDEWASTQWRSKGTIRVQEAANLVFHTADTYDGQSGSPICVARNGVLHLIAIHTGPFDTQRNKGVPVTVRMLQDVAGWINADLGYQGASIQNDTLIIQTKASSRSASVHVQRFADESVAEAFENASEASFDLEEAFESTEEEHEADAAAVRELDDEAYDFEAISEAPQQEDEEEEEQEGVQAQDQALLEPADPELADFASLEEGETAAVAAGRLGLAALPRQLVAVKGKDVELAPAVMDPGIYDGPIKYDIAPSLQSLLIDAMKATGFSHIVNVGLVDLTKGVNKPEFAGFHHKIQVSVASVAKIAAMLGAFQLRHDIRHALATKKSKSLGELFAAVRADWKGTHAAPFPKAPELERAFADVTRATVAIEFRSTGETKDQLSTLIDEFNAAVEATHKAWKELQKAIAKKDAALEKAGRAKVAATRDEFERKRKAIADLGILERLRISVGGNVPASNYATSTIVGDVGYVYIASSLVQSGLYDGKRNGGLWLASDYWNASNYWTKGAAFGSGLPVSSTAGSLAAFMTLLAQDRLVSPTSSIEMKALMKKEPNPTHPGITSWFKEGLMELKDQGQIKRVFSKVGVSKGATAAATRIDDCTIIERKVKVGSTEKLLCYVAVGLRSKKSAELKALILELDKCILANNGLTPKQGGHPDPSVAP